MYDVGHEEQLKKFREHLFGAGADCPRQASDAAHRLYFPPKGLVLIPCRPNAQGEWVPGRTIDNVVSEPKK